ncbi:MAG: YciI family protein [Kofleriaceae bacterium]|nr:YciI family protein [Kofleriaceae bacterium]
MLFMMMHKYDSTRDVDEKPSDELIRQMGRFIGRLLKEGIMKDGNGLHRSETRARVTFEGGAPKVMRGPYEGSNELVAGFALISTTGMERAIELATELCTASGGREIEVGPIVEGWDLHGGKRPDNAPYRFLLLMKADATYEKTGEVSGVKPLLEQWKRDGVLTGEATLLPSSRAARGQFKGGKQHWVDGPFAESKELVAGYAIVELRSFEDARTLTIEYATILGDVEVDIREVAA